MELKIKIRASSLLSNIYPCTRRNLVLKRIYIYIYTTKKKKLQKYLVCIKNIIANVFLGDVGVVGRVSKVIVSIKQI